MTMKYEKFSFNATPYEKIYGLRGQKNDMVDVTIRFIFLSDIEWHKKMVRELYEHQDHYLKNPQEKQKLLTYGRGFEESGIIYIKGSTRDDDDYRWLLLHELGHAVCDFDHSKIDGSIMHSHYKKWFKFKEGEE